MVKSGKPTRGRAKSQKDKPETTSAWAKRKEKLMANGYVSKSYEIPERTSNLIKIIAKKNNQTVGDVVADAILNLAEKLDIKTELKTSITLLDLDKQHKALKKMFLNFAKDMFYRNSGEEKTTSLINHIEAQSDDTKIRSEKFFDRLPKKYKPLFTSYPGYCIFLSAFNLKQK